MHQHHLEGLFKHRWLSPTARVSDDAIGLEWGLRICISEKLLGDADAAGLQIPLGEPLFYTNVSSLLMGGVLKSFFLDEDHKSAATQPLKNQGCLHCSTAGCSRIRKLARLLKCQVLLILQKDFGGNVELYHSLLFLRQE